MIHETAIIHPGAKLGSNVQVGPYTVIDEHVQLGDSCRVGPHVHLTGHTTIGAGTKIHAGAVIGDEPQDLGYDGSRTYLNVGENCTLREYVTIHRGSDAESATTVGDNVMLMAFCHLGHNCHIGNNVVIANTSTLAGHVEIEDRAFISAAVLIHQFVRIGTMAMISGGDRVVQDIPPFCMFHKHLRGPNTIGLRRAGIDAAGRTAIRAAIKAYFFSGLKRSNALQQIVEEHGDVPEVARFVTFIEGTKRGIASGPRTGTPKADDA